MLALTFLSFHYCYFWAFFMIMWPKSSKVKGNHFLKDHCMAVDNWA